MSFRIFIHGLESSNQGTKSVFFREKYPDMLIPYFTGPLDERMRDLRGVLIRKRGVILVGSSFGGLMATIFAVENEERVDRLILLAPAINLVEFADYVKKPECPDLPRRDEWPCGFGSDRPPNANGFFHRRSPVLPHGVLHGSKSISVPVWIYHGRSDEVIPLNDVERVGRSVFRDLSFHAVEDDHYLHKTFRRLDWDRLLSPECPPRDAHFLS